LNCEDEKGLPLFIGNPNGSEELCRLFMKCAMAYYNKRFNNNFFYENKNSILCSSFIFNDFRAIHG